LDKAGESRPKITEEKSDAKICVAYLISRIEEEGTRGVTD
jgi:hypothetical protein